MMGTTSGTVVSLLEVGFTIRVKSGADVMVKTQLPGHELSLKVGDRVEVYGGPDEGGRFFLSSGVYRKCPDGSIVRLRVNRMDAPDQVVQGATPKRPWWRFW